MLEEDEGELILKAPSASFTGYVSVSTEMKNNQNNVFVEYTCGDLYINPPSQNRFKWSMSLRTVSSCISVSLFLLRVKGTWAELDTVVTDDV